VAIASGTPSWSLSSIAVAPTNIRLVSISSEMASIYSAMKQKCVSAVYGLERETLAAIAAKRYRSFSAADLKRGLVVLGVPLVVGVLVEFLHRQTERTETLSGERFEMMHCRFL
jgi:hypothetical protein